MANVVTDADAIYVICPKCRREFCIHEHELGKARCLYCETDNLLELEGY